MFTITKMIDRWFARRAFKALNAVLDHRVGLNREEYEHCVETLDILRSKMYKDWNEK